jgi:hypothetical protein
MSQILITESSLRSLLRELMDSSTPVAINPVVDPQAAEADPTNSNFVPVNKIELLSAIRTLIDQVNDDESTNVYIAVKDAIEKEKEMKNPSSVEESVRMTIRKILLEAEKSPKLTKVPAGVHGSEFMQRFEKSKKGLQKKFASMRDDEYEYTPVDEPAAGRGRKNIMMSDVGGASFKDIAKEMGFAAESGAKQAVEKALSKAKFVMKMDLLEPEELEIAVLQSMSDYIDVLKNTKELSNEEIAMLKDNPGIVRELDGFREFLDKSLRKIRKDQESEE